MRHATYVLVALVGLLAGALSAILYANPAFIGPVAQASGSADRYQDYVMCTGACSVTPRAPTDAVWLLDYRTGKLLGTVIDRVLGKIVGWAEVDLVTEFGIPPKQDVHFMMITGSIAQGQAALYVAEVTTGKFGVYTLGPSPDGPGGVIIRRHDLTTFRAAK